MKTSNLVSVMIALVISTAGFAAIDRLFTEAYIAHNQASVELTRGA